MSVRVFFVLSVAVLASLSAFAAEKKAKAKPEKPGHEATTQYSGTTVRNADPHATASDGTADSTAGATVHNATTTANVKQTGAKLQNQQGQVVASGHSSAGSAKASSPKTTTRHAGGATGKHGGGVGAAPAAPSSQPTPAPNS